MRVLPAHTFLNLLQRLFQEQPRHHANDEPRQALCAAAPEIVPSHRSSCAEEDSNAGPFGGARGRGGPAARESVTIRRMKTTILTLLAGFSLSLGTAVAQPAPFNEAGVTMGHWHLTSKNVEADKKLFLAMGGKLYTPGGLPLLMFPGLYVNLALASGEKGDGGSEGSVVNHVGFIVDNVQLRVAQWKAAGVNVLPGLNNRLDQAFVVTADGVRMEILEDKTQAVPIRNEHVHLSLPDAEIPTAVQWYAKTFGGTVGTRNNAPVVNLPGVQLRFARADTKQAPTR